jgi:O-antigen ligase
MQLEVPLTLLLCSTLVWRIRDVSAISQQPLDAAGFMRVVLLGAAVCLTVAAVQPAKILQRLTGPTRLYALFIAVVLAGIPLATAPGLVAFRAIDLIAGTLVVAAAAASDPVRWLRRTITVLLAFTVGSLAVIFIEAIVFPARALIPIEEFGPRSALLPFRLGGVMPLVHPNTVGLYGILLIILAIAATDLRLVSSRVAVALSAWGVFAVLASQYRTGYVALVLLGLTYAFYRRRLIHALAGLLLVAIVGFMTGHLIQFTDSLQSLVLRGETVEVVSNLTGRRTWWEHALTAWQDSPWLGKGLSSGTRYEVLPQLGFGTSATIHSAWIEALVGAGVVGVALLAATFGVTMARAIRHRLVVPVLLLVALGVRSLTDSSIELMNYPAVVFLVTMQWVAHPPEKSEARAARPRPRTDIEELSPSKR